MKSTICVLLAVCIFAYCHGAFVGRKHLPRQNLLGSKECTWGPSYWCQNLTAAGDCGATKHCVQTVWIHKTLPPDSSSICQTCIDMVKQARDQLESNETQDLIKQVFETECSWLHLKPIVKECDKIADNYIPDLIDTLASQMNPQVVCSVAGLCNSAKVDKLLAEFGGVIPPRPKPTSVPVENSCDNCHSVVQLMENKFKTLSKDKFLENMLLFCGRMGSLADGCSNIVLTYFQDIYSYLRKAVNYPENICLLSGQCSINFHQHPEREVVNTLVAIKNKDDLPCEFCTQLVQHLRDLLVANTTELEFKKVLTGLCEQTKSFKDECLSLVEEYYGAVYNFLVTELNGTETCAMAGICPAANALSAAIISPLLPVSTLPKVISLTNEPEEIPIVSNQQQLLPIELMVPPHQMQSTYNTQYCVLCEYFLHFVQQKITEPKTEEEIKQIIGKTCARLPESMKGACTEFVNIYEPALVAILAQEIDPSQVCPLIKVCPAPKSTPDVDIFMKQTNKDNGKCPLCLFAVSRLEEMVKDKKTEANIKAALTKLCSKLSDNLAQECNDFVSTYTEEVVELMISDLTPQEVCVYLKLCTDSKKAVRTPAPVTKPLTGDIETNIIPDNTVNGVVLDIKYNQVARDPQCVLCEFIMKEIDDELKLNNSEAKIITTVHNICNHLPGSIKKQCNDFVNDYGDAVIQLLIASLEPSQVCTMMKLCSDSFDQVKVEIFDCAVCESAVWAMEKILSNKKIDHDMKHVLEKTCRALPKHDQEKCNEIIERYGTEIFHIIEHLANKKEVCKSVGLCSEESTRPKRLARKTLVGTSKCTYGPAYWCQSADNAQECGSGATKHCQQKVWRGPGPQ